MLFIIFRFYNSVPKFKKKIHLKKVGGFQMKTTLINSLTYCRLYYLSLRKDIFKEEIITEKGHEN